MKKLEEMIRTLVLPELCPHCREEMERVAAGLAAARSTFRQMRPRLRRQRSEAARLAEELLGTPPAERVRRIRMTRHRLRSRPLAEELLRRSRQAAGEDLEEARHLAELAALVSLNLFGNEELAGGVRGMNDLQALVLAHQGHTLRIEARRGEAEDRFARALRFLGQGSGDRRVLGEVQLLRSQLLRDQRRWQEASSALKEAAGVFAERGEEIQRGRALLLQASVHAGRGEGEASLRRLLEACVLLDGGPDSSLTRACWNQLAVTYAESGRLRSAREMLDESAHLLGEAPAGSAARARRAWAEGRVLAEEGRAADSEPLLRRSAEELLQRSFKVEAVLAHLDLARLLARQERGSELAALAGRLGEAVGAGPLGREPSTALGLLLEACRGAGSNADLLPRLEAAVGRCRHLAPWGG